MTCRRGGFIITEGLGGGAIIVRGYGGRGTVSEEVHLVEFNLAFRDMPSAIFEFNKTVEAELPFRDLPMMSFEFKELVEEELAVRDLEIHMSFNIQKRR